MKNKSVLALFKGFIGVKTYEINREGLKYGLIIPATASDDIFNEAVKLYGKDGKKWNQTLHKSWNKVATAPIEELVAEQVLHYLTTYGFEELGIFDHDTVYIPKEELNIPELEKGIEMISIKAYTQNEVKEHLMTLLTSGIALSKDTLAYAMDLSDLVDVDSIESVRNREMKVYLYDKYGVVPSNPDEFLRYLIYQLTCSTLKIQSKEMIASLKRIAYLHPEEVLSYFEKYVDRNDYIGLAQIFLRNKNLFLALKWHSMDIRRDYDRKTSVAGAKLNEMINKISKLAKKYHHPLPVNILDRLTDPDTDIISGQNLMNKLDSTTPYRQVRIINGLNYKLSGAQSYVYKIRNGKTYVKSKEAEKETFEFKPAHCDLRIRKTIVLAHLMDQIKPNVEGKTVLLDKNVNYKVPTSEKQYIGNIPCGSSVEIPKDGDIIIGIHWTNLTTGRVDLDLHMQSLNQSYGWNTGYRNTNQRVYFSGDLTDAPLPNGATELFYIGNEVEETFMFTVNNYNTCKEVPFEIVVAKADPKVTYTPYSNFSVDPNNIIATIPCKMDESQTMKRLGIVYVTKDNIRFVFDTFNTINSHISSNKSDIFKTSLDYMEKYQQTSLDLKTLLGLCDCKLVDSDYDGKIDIDLSLNNLQKDTLVSIFEKAVSK